MSKEIKSLMDSELLNEETKVVLQEAFDASIAAQTITLEEEYTQKLEEATQTLREATAQAIDEAIEEITNEIQAELVESRTQEVRYESELETFKEEYAENQRTEAAALISETVDEIVSEMKDEIEVARKYAFVQKLIESFGEGYAVLFGGADVDTLKELAEAKAELESLHKAAKIEELTESLTGKKKTVAMNILEDTPFDRLDEKFERVLPLLTEANLGIVDEDDKQLNENKTSTPVVVIEETETDKDVDIRMKRIYEKLNKSTQFAKKTVS